MSEPDQDLLGERRPHSNLLFYHALSSLVLGRSSRLGLAQVEVQTAAGAAKAEVTIERLPHFEAEALRDFTLHPDTGHQGRRTAGRGSMIS